MHFCGALCKLISICHFSRHGSGDDPPPGWSKERTREERRKLKRDQRKKQIELGKRRRVQEEQHGIVSGGNTDNLGSIGGELYPPSVPELTREGDGGGDGGLVFQPPVEMGNDDLRSGDSGGREMQGELTAVSLERKYSYAIMALSVVVLAVLMVATIFCCNSSNSTMAQAANARAALATQNEATAGGGASFRRRLQRGRHRWSAIRQLLDLFLQRWRWHDGHLWPSCPRIRRRRRRNGHSWWSVATHRNAEEYEVNGE